MTKAGKSRSPKSLDREPALLRTLVDALPDGVFMKDADSRFVLANVALAATMGVDSPNRLLGKTDHDFYPAEEADHYLKDERRIIETGEGIVDKVEPKVVAGSPRMIIVTKLPVRGPRKRVVGIVGISRDVTDQKRSESDLAFHKALLDQLMDNIPDYVYFKDAESRFLRVSRSLARGFGLAQPEAAVGKTDFDFFGGGHAQNAFADERSIVETGEPIVNKEELESWHDGREAWVLTTKLPFRDPKGRVIGTFGISRDVTERKRFESDLQFQRALLDQLMDYIPDKVYFKDRESRFVRISKAQARDFGLSDPASAIGRTDFDFFVESHAREALKDERAVIDSGAAIVDKEELERFPDGRQGWALTTKLPFRDTTGGIIGTFGISHDITERKQFEAQLAFQKALLDQLMDNIPDYVYFKDAESHFIRISTSLAATFGLANANEAVGRWDGDYFPKDIADKAREDEAAVIRDGIPLVNKEERGSNARNREEWVLTTKMPFRDAHGAVIGTFGISRSIAELKRTEMELRMRLGQLEAVNRISTTARSARTLDTLLPTLLEMTLSVMEFARGAIWLHDPLSNMLKPAAHIGYDHPAFSKLLDVEGGIAGISSVAFARGSANVVFDLHADERIPAEVRATIPPGTFCVAVPLRATHDVIIGTLAVGADPPRAIDASDMSLLTTISEMAGSAIHRTRLHEQTEERLRQVAGLREIDKAIATSFDLHRNLQTVLSQVVSLLRADAAVVFTMNASSGMLEHALSTGIADRSALSTVQIRLGEGVAGRAALDRTTIQIDNVRAKPEYEPLARLDNRSFVSCICAPLIAKGEVKGVLEVLHRAPFVPSSDWIEFFEALTGQAAIVVENSALFESTLRSKDELTMAYDATIEGWSRALDLRDKETEGHSLRVTAMTSKMARALGMGEEDLARVRWGALLHDIGKMGIPDAILLKPGPLTDEEWVIMRRHPTLAFEMLAPIEYLKNAIDIPYCHHEKWGGSGYPRGLKGAQIPVAARLFAVTDVWDALTSNRPYREAWSGERVREHLLKLSGTEFDPRAVEIFLEVLDTDALRTASGG